MRQLFFSLLMSCFCSLNVQAACDNPVDDKEFEKKYQFFTQFGDKKDKMIRSFVKMNCITALQAQQLVNLYLFEDQKLSFAKFAYRYNHDPKNYYIVGDALTETESMEKFQLFLAQQSNNNQQGNNGNNISPVPDQEDRPVWNNNNGKGDGTIDPPEDETEEKEDDNGGGKGDGKGDENIDPYEDETEEEEDEEGSDGGGKGDGKGDENIDPYEDETEEEEDGGNNNNDDYNGRSACRPAVPANTFKSFLISLKDKSFESTKTELAMNWTRRNKCVNTNQILQILNEFSFESSRMEYAKFVHAYTYDQDNFPILFEAFDFDMSIDELKEFIND